MTPYNMKTHAEGFLICKFDDDLNPVDTYIVKPEICTCPAGHRPVCKHRTMLDIFKRDDKINTEWFFDWDTRQWAQLLATVDGTIDHDKVLAATAEPEPERIDRSTKIERRF